MIKNEDGIKHNSFTVERNYNASPARVYQTWADADIKSRWMKKAERFDFRVGGGETYRMGLPDGVICTSDSTFLDIVPEKRIVYSFALDMDKVPVYAALITVEFQSANDGTKIVYTEQCALLDGSESIEPYKQGAMKSLESLNKELSRQN